MQVADMASQVKLRGESSRALRLQRLKPWFAIAATLLVGALAFLALHHLTQEVRLRDVLAALHSVPASRIGLSLGLTALSYLALTFYDVIALRIVGRKLPWRIAALASFTSYTLSHNLGLALLTGGSARLRVYSNAGISPADVVRIIAIAGITFWSGVFVVTGIALLVREGPLPVGAWVFDAAVQRTLGALILAATAILLALAARGRKQLTLFGWALPLPTLPQALAQIAIATLDLAAASAALFVLMPGLGPEAYPAFFLGYALAIIATLLSHVPGGLGVFEAVIVASVPAETAPLLAALVAYRAIYYLLPLLLAAVLLAAAEGRRLRHPISRALTTAQSLAQAVAPLLLSLLVFLGGIVLLVSGAFPADPARIRWLRLLPLPFIEGSHLAGSIVGTALLLLAPALYRRLDAAFHLTRALLIAGALFSLGKGLDYEEAIVLVLVAGLLQWTRPAFYRRTRLTAEPISPSWTVLILIGLGLSIWIGFFAYRHVDYSNELWWSFAYHGNASRFLRGSLAAAVFLTGWSLMGLFAPAARRDVGPRLPDGVAEAALAKADRSDAMLAFTGNKSFLVAPSGDAFLMYGRRGRTWVVMGDPVGPVETWPDLVWTLRTMADEAQARLLLYQISEEALPIAIDLGLQIVKYGEEAQVNLSSFTLEGSRARNIRQATNRAERNGVSFELLSPAEWAPMLPEFKALSDLWLAEKGGEEKGFSLGRFDPDYLRRFRVALVRDGDRVMAFANVWATPNKAELSVDLMRHGPNVPNGIMEYLFASLMRWGQAQGYARFNLGLAPLSGIEARRLSPTWAKAAAFLFRHGERFYGFEGLRAFKDRFSPEWVPRYIAGPRGLALVRALLDLRSLIG